MQQGLKAGSSARDVLIGPYRVLKTLGTGNFAQVKLAVHLHTEVQVALKTLEKDKKNATLISNELEIMKLVDHPNITKLFHVMETTEHICLVMEYASGGDLAGRIIEVSYIHEEEARHIFTQIVCAVSYCHENGIAHRDIKPENILMDANRNIKLCDFGLAIKVNTAQKSTVFCGTLPYCAPELFSIQSYDPRALDIWSMGVVLYIMVTKHYPFKATTYDKMKEEMQDPHYYIPPKLPALIANLIVQLFTIDPMQRPKIGDVMEHQWLQGSEAFSKMNLSQETPTSKPNPSIMAAMGAMGYSPEDIRDSLYKQKFNSIMATYLILKHQSPRGDIANHKVKLRQPTIGMIPTDPPTVHLFLKKIGSEPDHSTSASPAKDQSHNDDKLVRKDSKNHSMTNVPCCQKMSLLPQTASQCGPVQHHQELLLNSSLQKRDVACSAVSCGPVQNDREQLLNSSLQKRDMVSKAVSCGPVQHDDEQPLNRGLQKRDVACSAVSCGPVQNDHEQLSNSSLQKRDMVSKAVSCGPVQNDHEQLLNRGLQKRNVACSAVSCGPVQHDDEQLLNRGLQKRDVACSAVSCGPVQNDHAQLLRSSLQKRSTASRAVSYGPVKYDDEHSLSSSLQKRNTASRVVSYSPVHENHEQLLNSSLQKKDVVSKAGSRGPVQYEHAQLLRSSLQKGSTASSAVSCSLVKYDDEQPMSSSIQKRNMASRVMSCDSVEYNDEQFLSSSLQKRNMPASAVSCDPVEYDNEQPLSSSLQKRGMVFKAMSYGPVQCVHEQLLCSSFQKKTSEAVFCGSMQHDHGQLLSSSMQKRNIVASRDVSSGTASSMGTLSEYHTFQEDPQDESLTKCSSYLSNISSVWSSEDMTTTDSHHKDRSLSLQETSEPDFASTSPQNLWGGWKQVKRRTAKCLRRLCCCLPAQRRSCTSQRRVVPEEAGESEVTENQVSGDSGVTQNQALLQ
ncbi:serine/threonine-protein kinase par-1-like isoform X3 [Mastomys coucha]|uniref:serine/threonine-protein kinase par-1-like isoform X3 n=1 Tax=Mastomys coucha TaxID=35658 RepID=UPI0012614056|nr:serine/threonine-protein kinase par-1-like isoform X3 [Mastomys coucha]XP_031214421.1 serine/threonine-protein kinase par-1-like isoform X3 [Mastomys coucha]